MTDAVDLDIDTLVSLLGALPEHRDERLDLPLTEQVRILLDLACAHRPDFQRNIPVKATDHDIVICEVLVKLITALAERSGPVLFEGTITERPNPDRAFVPRVTIRLDDHVSVERGQRVRVFAIDQETDQ